MRKTIRDYESEIALSKALAVVDTRHKDSGRGGAAKEGAEPNDVTQLSAAVGDACKSP